VIHFKNGLNSDFKFISTASKMLGLWNLPFSRLSVFPC